MDFSTGHRWLNPKRLYMFLVAAVRILFCTLNNLYCIPVHFCWLFLLQPVKWLAPGLYWHIEGIMFRWLLSMVALWSYSSGYHVMEMGDDIWDLKDERVLVLFNHQSTADVPLIMAAFNSRSQLFNNIMWIMDHIFKYTNFGLVSWAHGDFFIQGGKDHRDSSLVKLEKHLRNFYIPKKRKWLVLFPEGGFLKNRKPSSQRFAQKNNLPVLENVSLPRVGALKVILDTVAADRHDEKSDTIKYLLDVTIAYPGGDPLDLPTIFGGWRPSCNTIFHYRRFDIEEVPKEEEALTEWLYSRYVEKESILQEYYDTGVFPEAPTLHAPGYPAKDVPRLRGIQVVHDPLEFILRHCFYLASTYLWATAILWVFSCLMSLLW